MATTSPESATPTLDARKTGLLVRFTAAGDVSTDQYDETIRRLEKSGDWLPEGLTTTAHSGRTASFESARSGTHESSSTRSASASCPC